MDREILGSFPSVSSRVSARFAHKRPLTAHGVVAWQKVIILKFDNCDSVYS